MKRLFLIFSVLIMACSARAQWEEDVRLTYTNDTSTLSLSMSHTIAATGDTVHVVWRERGWYNSDIFYKRSIDGGLNWGQDTKITSEYAWSGSPSISLSGPLVHVVWTEKRNGKYEIYYNRSIDGGTSWEGETRLTDDVSSSYESVVASSGSSVHVIWVNTDLNFYWQVLYKHSTDGGITWGPESWLSGSSVNAYNPSIAVSGSDVYVAWNDGRDGNLKLYFVKSSDNGLTWDPEIRLTDDTDGSAFPSIAVSGSTIHIVWADVRNKIYEIYYKGSADGGINWSEDTRISIDPAFSFYPSLAVSDSFLHVVWREFYEGYFSIVYNYSADGGKTWDTETKLNDFPCDTELPSIAVSGPVLHVIWDDYREYNYEVYYKRNPTGGMPVGIEDEPFGGSGGLISIHPNPGRQLTVGQLDNWTVGQLDNWTVGQTAVPGQRSAVKISILDIYGREIKEFANISSLPYQVDISDLSDGVYLLRVVDDEGKSGSAKFLKITQ